MVWTRRYSRSCSLISRAKVVLRAPNPKPGLLSVTWVTEFKHACRSCMHFHAWLTVQELSHCMHIFMPEACMHSSCMHENACKCANLLACGMHASCMHCMHVACMPACMIHACSAGMHSLEGLGSQLTSTTTPNFLQTKHQLAIYTPLKSINT